MFFLSLVLYVIISLLSFYVSYFILILLIPVIFLSYYFTKDKKIIFYGLSLSIILIILCLVMQRINDANFNSISGIIINRKKSYFILLTKYGRYLIYDKENKYQLFSIIKVEGKLNQIIQKHYESGFDFIFYLKSKGVTRQINIDNIITIFNAPTFIYKYKNVVTSFLNEDSKSIIDSMLFGERIDEIKFASIENLEMLAIFSLSGFHINKVSNLLSNVIVRKKKISKHIIPIIICSFFLILSDFKYSLRRIFLYNVLSLINDKKIKRISNIELLSITCLIFLILEPYSILSSSFYYSFPFLFYNQIFPIKKKSKILIILRIFLFYFPFYLFSNNTVSLLNPLFQILISPLIIILFFLSLILFLIPPFGFILNYLISVLIGLCNGIDKINILMYSGEIKIYFFIIYYFFLMLLNIIKTYQYNFLFNKILIPFIIFNSSVFIPDYTNKYEVHYIDVDQGDCTLIRFKQYNILIDVGGIVNVDLAKESLIPYFRKKKIRKIDYAILTHLDYDHYGSLPSLQENFIIDNVLQVEDFISNNNTLSLKDFKIINLNDYDLNLTKDKNYHSGVYKFEIKNNSFLIMGDAPKEIEYKILSDNKDIDVDYLKVGHHGSNTSSSDEFIKSCMPKEAIISCGLNNKYNFPHDEVISTLNKYNVKIRRTDLEGTIVYRF